MKKNVFLAMVVILTATFFFQAQAQEEEKLQHWFCHVEQVKPGKIMQFFEVTTEITKQLKQQDFPFTFYVWQDNNMVFESWYPIDSSADIDKIFEAWGKVELDEDIERKYDECMASYEMRTFMSVDKLSNPPKDGSLIPEDVNFCHFQQIGFEASNSKKFMESVANVKELAKELFPMENADYGIYGGLGYTNPSFIFIQLCKNKKEWDRLNEEEWQKLSKEDQEKMTQANTKVMDFATTIQMKELYLARKISYIKN